LETLPLFKTFQERKLFILITFFLFSINLLIEFQNYKTFTVNEIYHTNGIISNIYHKKNYDILKIKTKNFTVFTKYNHKKELYILNNINIYLITEQISFISYLKKFYANSINITHIKQTDDNKRKAYNYIYTQHKNQDISSLYSALFLATPITQNIRDFSNNLGISHLIALSGFHLGIIAVVLYFLLNLFYSKIHLKYLPYRNKKFDIMILVSLLLFLYMIFINTPPSLLRAFCMFIFGLFLLRNNIKIISFETLFIISLIIIALFPKLLFSLSLWFSIAGVFYIFLFLQYFRKINKILQFLLFNIWIYLAINPITHYFFPTTSIEQLYSPLLSILFSLFYPISAVLHLFGFGSVLDSIMESFIYIKINSYEIFTVDWFFILYLLISFIAIVKKEAFLLLNILLIVYNIWLFHFVF